jgi:hypothetical protein
VDLDIAFVKFLGHLPLVELHMLRDVEFRQALLLHLVMVWRRYALLVGLLGEVLDPSMQHLVLRSQLLDGFLILGLSQLHFPNSHLQ